ncbi:hypothetical protein CKA32_005388 [Geitlerinema sp. FC II]|nr:hypothetical protein CKA32_005388 [Geitlerinema sp. FC II]
MRLTFFKGSFLTIEKKCFEVLTSLKKFCRIGFNCHEPDGCKVLLN